MNEGDQSQQHEAFALKVAMANHRSIAASTYYPGPIGCCHNCRESFPANDLKLFCDKDCQDDWENRREAAKRKRGG